MLAFAALLAQVLALALLAFAPAALLIGIFPGAGHRLFKAWLSKLLMTLVIKAVYSLVLAILVGVSLALTASVGAVSYLLAFGLQSAFFWTVFIKRKALAGIWIKQREITRIESTSRSAIATPIAAVAGVGAGVLAALRTRGKDDEADDVDDGQQKHPARPATTAEPAPTMQPTEAPEPVSTPRSRREEEDDTVEHEPVSRPEPTHAGREELTSAVAPKPGEEPRTMELRRPTTVAEAIDTAQRGQRPAEGQERATRPEGPRVEQRDDDDWGWPQRAPGSAGSAGVGETSLRPARDPAPAEDHLPPPRDPTQSD
jgi:hypothetical protein